LQENDISLESIVALGDQLVTDILGFNRLNLFSVLVKTIDKKSQKWYTKINRLREKRILKNIRKTNMEIYRKIEEIYE
jgi:predicted HAD superfamily phosphohydrolase YqeG